jgi:hypothetical protein
MALSGCFAPVATKDCLQRMPLTEPKGCARRMLQIRRRVLGQAKRVGESILADK